MVRNMRLLSLWGPLDSILLSLPFAVCLGLLGKRVQSCGVHYQQHVLALALLLPLTLAPLVWSFPSCSWGWAVGEPVAEESRQTEAGGRQTAICWGQERLSLIGFSLVAQGHSLR